jgi:O-antigen/teichoic acid export membrane protein
VVISEPDKHRVILIMASSLIAKYKQVMQHPSLQKIVRNMGWLFFDKLVRMSLGLLVGAWVARYLGPSQYGELAYVLAFIAAFQAVALLGMDGIIVRDIARNEESAGQILGTAFALRLFAGGLCWLAAVGSMAWLHGWQDRSVQIAALAGSSLIFQAADTIDLWFQSQSQSRRTVLAKLVAYILSNGIKVVLILNKAPLIAFAAVLAFDVFVAAIALIVAYYYFPCKSHLQAIKTKAIHILGESWPFMLSGLSIIIYMRIDQIMIKEMLGEKELGIYSAVLPLATLWQFIPMTLVASLAPFLAKQKAESEVAYMNSLQNIFRLFSLLGWLVCLPIMLLSGVIVNILYGNAYADGASILMIYIFTNIFINMGVAQSLWLLNENKPKISLYKTLIGVLTSLIGNAILIPRMGVVGVAVVAVVAQFLSAMLSNLIFAPNIFRIQLRSLLLLKPHN